MAARGIRITGGGLRGQLLSVPRGIDVRPMRGRVREALFSILGDRVAGARVLDAFAGSGALGAEAISRGARSVLFVERERSVLTVLRENLRRLGLTAQGEVHEGSAYAPLPRDPEEFDLVLLDPPFPDFRAGDPGRDPWRLAARLARTRVAPGGTIVLEHPAQESQPEPPAGTRSEVSRRYGETALTIWVVEGR